MKYDTAQPCVYCQAPTTDAIQEEAQKVRKTKDGPIVIAAERHAPCCPECRAKVKRLSPTMGRRISTYQAERNAGAQERLC